VTGYTASCVSSDGGTARTGTGTATPISVTSLSVGKTYTCAVSATNVIGTGAASTASTAFTAATVPGVPTIGAATRGNATVAVAFSAPGSTGSSTITGYSVSCTSSDGGAAGSATGASSPVSLTALTIGKSYTCTARAVNAIGQSLPSGATAAFVFASVPGAPAGVSALRGNQSATVAFVAPLSAGGASITTYTANCTSSNGGAAGTVSGSTSPRVVTGLTNGKTYTCKVRATNVIGAGGWSTNSTTFVPASVPGAPTAVTATRGNGQASVVFTAPANTGGFAITGYSLACFSTNGGSAGYASGVSSPVVVKGLTNGKTYTCRVRAVNAVGEGPQSAASNTFVPARVPGAPTVTAVLKTASGQIRVSFSAPAFNGGSVVTSYAAQCTSVNGGASGTVSGASSPLTVTALTAGKSYTCKVRATNAIGPGAWSANSASITA